MRKTPSVVFFLFLTIFGYSQMEIGMKIGVNTSEIETKTIINDQNNQYFELDPAKSIYGYHFGLYGQLSLASIYIQPSVLFNSSKVNYRITEFSEGSILNSIRTEKFNTVDIPLLVGMKIGFIRLHTGPIAHIHFSSKSELIQTEAYEQKFKEASYGFQIGTGLSFWKLRMDINYESNFSRFGEQILINGTEFEIDKNVARILCTLGYKF